MMRHLITHRPMTPLFHVKPSISAVRTNAVSTCTIGTEGNARQ